MRVNDVRIAEPCGQDWGAMQGDARRRHCLACDRHVHDLSAMDERAARRLLRRSPNVCVRYVCRADGTVVHAERRLGRTLLPRALALLGAAAVATPAFAGVAVTAERSTWELIRDRVAEWLAPAPEAVETKMGEVRPTEPPSVVPEPPGEPREVVMGRVAPQRPPPTE